MCRCPNPVALTWCCAYAPSRRTSLEAKSQSLEVIPHQEVGGQNAEQTQGMTGARFHWFSVTQPLIIPRRFALTEASRHNRVLNISRIPCLVLNTPQEHFQKKIECKRMFQKPFVSSLGISKCHPQFRFLCRPNRTKRIKKSRLETRTVNSYIVQFS